MDGAREETDTECCAGAGMQISGSAVILQPALSQQQALAYPYKLPVLREEAA